LFLKILWVKAGGLVPPDTGGKIRSYQILKELAKRHSVTLFTFYMAHSEDQHPSLKSVFENVICYPLSVPAGRGFGQAVNYARKFLSGRPFSVSKYCLPQVAVALRELVTNERYDVMVCDFVFTGDVIPWDVPVQKIVFTHNVEALIWRRHFEVARHPLWKFVSYVEHRRTERFERACLKRADHVLTVSDVDGALFAKYLNAAKISSIPTGVDTEYFQMSSEPVKPHSLVFTGSMDWMPNEDAIFYFGKEILPRICEQIPDVAVTVVGRSPSGRLQDFAATNRITLTGRVADIRPFVHQAAVYFVPLRVGGGTRLKIYEAMAMGKPVVSTTIGAEGLPLTQSRDVLIADRPAEFSDAIVHLLTNDDARLRLGRAARELVEQRFSWRSVAECVDEIVTRVAKSAAC
jgi:sugar transferase (PEP-CTERM/EpsH1 system associated)